MKILFLATVLARLACQDPLLPTAETGLELPSHSKPDPNTPLPAETETLSEKVAEPDNEAMIPADQPEQPAAAEKTAEVAAQSENAPIEPIESPVQETPVIPPVQETPVIPPVQETPITPPAQETPITPPAQDTPITPPAQETPITPPVQETPITPVKELDSSAASPSSSFSKLPLIILSISVLSVTALIALSAFHRSYLARYKKAPIDAPVWLSCLFPKPRNYEKEMSKLCQKYLELKP